MTPKQYDDKNHPQHFQIGRAQVDDETAWHCKQEIRNSGWACEPAVKNLITDRCRGDILRIALAPFLLDHFSDS